MKKFFAFGLFLLTLSLSNSFAQSTEAVGPPMDGPKIEFEQETIDFGTLPHKGNASASFVVWNRGTADLVISSCKGSCGCTVPVCPTTAIKPGESAKIPVTYDSNRIGYFTKNVTVSSNAINEPNKMLTIKGNIEAPIETPPVTPPATPVAPGHEGHGHN